MGVGTGAGAIGIQGPHITALALSTREHISCGFLVTIVQLPVAGTRTPRVGWTHTSVYACAWRAFIEILAVQFSFKKHKANGENSLHFKGTRARKFRGCFVWDCSEATSRATAKKKKKGIVRRVGGKTRAAVLFRVIATRTEASKGFVFVSQLGSVRWITLHCSFMHAFFLNWWSGESTLTKGERVCLERVSYHFRSYASGCRSL